MFPTPDYMAGFFNDTAQDNAKIMRAEYVTARQGLPVFEPLNFQDVPCSVCSATARAVQMSAWRVGVGVFVHVEPWLTIVTVAVPGKLNCPTGLVKLYAGYLMANHFTSLQTNEYVCVDANAEPTADSSALDDPSTNLYPTEANTVPPGSGYTVGASWHGIERAG
jgi:hypothetical protein